MRGSCPKKNLSALDWVEQKSCVCTSHPSSYTYKHLRLDIEYFALPVNDHGRNCEACPLTPLSDQLTKAGEGEFVRCEKEMKVQGSSPCLHLTEVSVQSNLSNEPRQVASAPIMW
jgi:hypothetical protein